MTTQTLKPCPACGDDSFTLASEGGWWTHSHECDHMHVRLQSWDADAVRRMWHAIVDGADDDAEVSKCAM